MLSHSYICFGCYGLIYPPCVKQKHENINVPNHSELQQFPTIVLVNSATKIAVSSLVACQLVGCNRGMCSFQMKLNINGIRWEKNQHTTNKQWGGRHHQKQTHVKSSVKLGLINQHFLFCTCLVPFQMGISAIKYDKVSKNIPLFHWRQRICIRKNRLIPKLFVPSGLTCW